MKLTKVALMGMAALALSACGDDDDIAPSVRDGIDGQDGENGKDGQDGRDGVDGQDGTPGMNGQDGRDGLDGAPGMNGQDGRDGVSFIPTGPTFRDNDLILTDPMLTGPTAGSVNVVWYTEFEGDAHRLVYGERLDNTAVATTTRMSRQFEDAQSQILGRPTPVITSTTQVWVRRPIYRHSATASGLTAGVRVPYYVQTTVNGVTFTSRAFTLQPRPASNQPVKLLLTSDQQNRAMSPANFEKVVETVGLVDAVLFAGDFVDTPNRSSEWFDRDNVGRPAFFPAMQGRFQEMFPEHPYRGGEILQHAPVFGTIGNHESPGRFGNDLTIGAMDGEPRPRWFAQWQWNQLTAAERAATGLTEAEFVLNRSFDHLTYYEMWDLPTNGVAGEDPENFYAVRYGNVHITSMNVSRVWRNWNNGFTNSGRGKFAEPVNTINDLDTWGFGDMFFQTYAPNSPQRSWLGQVLQSAEFTSAPYSVVLAHQTMFGHGDNAVPVMADPEATITFVDGSTPIVTTFPAATATWNAIVAAAAANNIATVHYQYRAADDLWLGVERELVAAGSQLVHTGHSHTWCRSFVDDMATGNRLNYIETSNVGNTFGPTVNFNRRVTWARNFYPDPTTNDTRDPAFWTPSDYPRIGDPQNRPDVAPSRIEDIDVMAQIEGGAPGLPFISSNRITVFTILDSADGTVRSYAHDTEYPRLPAFEVDCFPLDESVTTNPCDR